MNQDQETCEASTPVGVDFNQSPFLVIWECTRACDLACLHCRATAIPEPDPNELTHEEGLRLIRAIKDAGAKILVFTGGDPLKRDDLFELIAYAKSLHLRVGTIPAASSALTIKNLQKLKVAGVDQIAFSLDSADPVEHDQFRRTPRVFQQTVEALKASRSIGLRTQVNSLVNVHNSSALEPLMTLVESLGVVFWEVFFLVPTGRGRSLPLLAAERFEQAFEKIHALSRRVPFIVKVTEAPHYRRYVLEKTQVSGNGHVTLPAELRKEAGPAGGIGHAPQGVNAGKGFVFISSTGDIFPSGFLPIRAGNVRESSLTEIYRDSPLMRQLRDTSLLKGRCGRCRYREICGGSRARAYAMSGDYLAEDPCCVYEPPAYS